jgi:hypothetical protein
MIGGILGDVGPLEYDHTIAALVNLIGEGLILLSFLWKSGILLSPKLSAIVNSNFLLSIAFY